MDEFPKTAANCAPLTPLTFLHRAAAAYANRTSIIYENTKFTWAQTYDRCCRLASYLRSINIRRNDVVSVLAPNVPAMIEVHFGVPMAGAILNAINTRLDSKNIATILRHSEAKVFFVDVQFVGLAQEAIGHLASESGTKTPLAVLIDDIDKPSNIQPFGLEYEVILRKLDPCFGPVELEDEWDPIALNYTSGTTAAPKGVVCSHRAAYLSALSIIIGWEMGNEPVYLWSLPMFHCNGWTFAWGIAARGGTHVCIRNTTAYRIYRHIADHGVTHMCCAPVVFNILIDAKPSERRQISSPVQVLTGGAPPPESLLAKMEPMGFQITHSYGLTEVTGPATVCEWQAKWNKLSLREQAKLKARQGLGILTLADIDIKDLATMKSLPRDGKSTGEIVLRGSGIMKGYFKDPEATSKVFRGGWFATGDVGVIHPDGYVEIKDRSKDIIISGGENISSIEVESVLYKHSKVREAAVVAMPSKRWGESPCAFVSVRDGGSEKATESDIAAFCRRNLPHFMTPKKVVIMEELPKSSTNKILKANLRLTAKNFTADEESSDKPERHGEVGKPTDNRNGAFGRNQVSFISRL